MKDTPFPPHLRCHPQEESSRPFSQQTPPGWAGELGQVPPTPSPIPSSPILGCFSRRQMRASRSSFWWSETHRCPDESRGGRHLHPPHLSLLTASNDLLPGPGQGRSGRASWSFLKKAVRCSGRETQAAVRQKSFPRPGSRFSGFSTEGHLLPVSEPNSRQLGTPPPHIRL